MCLGGLSAEVLNEVGADFEMQCKKVGMMIGLNCKTNLDKKARQEY